MRCNNFPLVYDSLSPQQLRDNDFVFSDFQQVIENLQAWKLVFRRLRIESIKNDSTLKLRYL